jgi:hypothetical protein
MKNYYSILGVSATAHEADIKRAYRKLALQYHPDRNASPQAEQFFKEVNEAYDVLSDSQKRYEYDQRLLNPLHTGTYTAAQPTHRDPRYRPHTQAQPRKPSAEQELMQRAVPYLTKVAWVGIFLVIVMLADVALPAQIETTPIIGFRSTRVRHTSQEHMITASGSYRITDEAMLKLHVGDTVEIIHSAFLNRLVRLQCNDVYITNLATVYSNYVFVPILLCILSVLGVLLRNKIEFQFNVGIVNIFALVITLILLLT